MVRAPFFDRNGMKKGAWSAEEDHKLRSYIQKYGHWNWRELPKFAGLKRCGKSCRLRWMNYLRPDVKHGNYTEEEDALIMELHEKFGKRWSMIAAKLPGRTDNEIKNHWHTHLKKRANKNRTTSDDGKDYSPGSASQSDHDHEATHNSEAEAESLQLIISSLPNMILESSLLSPTTSSSTELSAFSSSDGGSISISNMGACSSEEFCLLPCSERCEDQSSGDFWSQPFLADNSSNISNMGACASEDFSLLPCSSERCEDQSSGDFWSQPFVADNIYNQDGPQLPCDDMFFDDLPFLVDLYPLMQDWQ